MAPKPEKYKSCMEQKNKSISLDFEVECEEGDKIDPHRGSNLS